MIVLYILAGIGVIVLFLMLKGVWTRTTIATQHQLTPDQVRAVAIIAAFFDEQTERPFPGRTAAIAGFVKEQPVDWASGVARGFISPAVAAMTLRYEPNEHACAPESEEHSGLGAHEETAFWALNNAWARFMRGLMPRPLQIKLERYVRGFDETRSDSIGSDWEAARNELCKWAETMVDSECPDGSKLSVVLRRARMEPTNMIPSDFNLEYTDTESPSWII